MTQQKIDEDTSRAALGWFLLVLAMLLIWIENTRTIPILDHVTETLLWSFELPPIIFLLLGLLLFIGRIAIVSIPSFAIYRYLKPQWQTLTNRWKIPILFLLWILTAALIMYGMSQTSDSFIYTFLPSHPRYNSLTYSDQMGMGTLMQMEAYGFIVTSIFWVIGCVYAFRWITWGRAMTT